MKTKLFYLAACFVAFTFTSCETDETPQSNDASQSKVSIANISSIANMTPTFTTNLVVGSQNDAGDVNVYEDATTVYVEYKTTLNWYVRKVQLYVGKYELIPTNSVGIAVSDRFPFSNTYANGTQSVVYAIAKSSLPGCFTISARADVYRFTIGNTIQNATAWGEGEKFTSRDLGMFFNVCLPTQS